MKKTLKYSVLGLLIGLIVWGISILFFISHPGKIIELKGLDYLFYLRGSIPPPEDIIIVAIDETSFSELKLPWPWPRKLHAQLIRNLSEAGAKIIAFDILFADPTTEENDTALAQATNEAGNVILPSDINIVEERGYKQILETEPIPILRETAAGTGTSTLIYDPDNFVRRCRLRFSNINSFVYEILKLCKIKDLPPPDKDILINFVGPSRSIKTVSYYQTLNYQEYLPEGIFKDKIVFVGRSLLASPEPQAKQPDIFATPFYKVQMSGVEIMANLTDTILRNRFIEEPRIKTIFLTFLLALIILSIVLIRTGYIPGLLLTFVSILLYLGVTIWSFSYHNILLPAFIPCIGIGLVYSFDSLAKYFIIEQEEKYLKKAFRKYVPPSVVKQILEEPEKLKLGGDRITGTVLFSDLAGFAAISEKFTPEGLVSFINEYLSAVTGIIFGYHGTITRFIGDAVLAVWGAPIWHKDHAIRACSAAIKMQDKVKELDIGWKKRDLPELKVRVGISTGSMVVGNMGSRSHFDYTAMGDAVNLGARLQEANKFYGTSIIINKQTADLLQDRFTLRTLDKLMVKGKEEHLVAYELICEKTKVSRLLLDTLSLYQQGLEAEWNKQWDKAIDFFKKSLELTPQDKPARIHLERCRQYKKEPPPNGWDGTFALK